MVPAQYAGIAFSGGITEYVIALNQHVTDSSRLSTNYLPKWVKITAVLVSFFVGLKQNVMDNQNKRNYAAISMKSHKFIIVPPPALYPSVTAPETRITIKTTQHFVTVTWTMFGGYFDVRRSSQSFVLVPLTF